MEKRRKGQIKQNRVSAWLYIICMDLNPAVLCHSIVFLYNENKYLGINFNITEKRFLLTLTEFQLGKFFTKIILNI